MKSVGDVVLILKSEQEFDKVPIWYKECESRPGQMRLNVAEGSLKLLIRQVTSGLLISSSWTVSILSCESCEYVFAQSFSDSCSNLYRGRGIFSRFSRCSFCSVDFDLGTELGITAELLQNYEFQNNS